MTSIKILIPKLDGSGPANGAKALAYWLNASKIYNIEICETKKDVKLEHADLVISMCFSSDFHAYASRLKYNFKWISSLRSNIYQDYRYLYGIKGLILAVLHNFLLLKADKVICMYQSMSKSLWIKLPRKAIEICPNLISNNKYNIDNKNAKLERLIVIGKLIQRKGVAELSTLFPYFKEMNLQLVFIGEGDLRKFLENQIRFYNCDENVKLLGFKEDPYLFFQPGDYVLSNSSSEGMSRALLDCLNCGVPVISNDIGQASDFIINGRNGYKYSNINELKKIVDELTLGSKNLTEIALSANYIPANVAKLWLKLIKNCLSDVC